VRAFSTYGLANVEHQVPVRHDTMFSVGIARQTIHGYRGADARGAGRSRSTIRSASTCRRVRRVAPITVREPSITRPDHDFEEDGGGVSTCTANTATTQIIRVRAVVPARLRGCSRGSTTTWATSLRRIIVTRVGRGCSRRVSDRGGLPTLGMRNAARHQPTRDRPESRRWLYRTASGHSQPRIRVQRR